MLTALIENARRCCSVALASPELIRIADALHHHGVDHETADRLVHELSERDTLVRDRLVTIRTSIASTDGAFERLLLLRSAVRSLPRITSLPVDDDVKRLFCEAYEYVASPPHGASFDVTRGSFVAHCKLASLRRFPAGQFHWEISGIPRSWVLKVKGRERLTLLRWIATKLKGFGPVFFSHLNANRKNRYVITERESNRSYYRMAKSLRLQPDVRALVTSSWFNSPDTFRVSPHLGWMNRTFADNGALIVTMGAAEPDCGVLARSPERKKAYSEGTFAPTLGLVIWPRDAMLAWAETWSDSGAGRLETPRCSEGPRLAKAGLDDRQRESEVSRHAVARHAG